MATEKVSLEHGRTVWQFKLKTRGEEASPPAITRSFDDVMGRIIDSAKGSEGEVDDSDIPF